MRRQPQQKSPRPYIPDLGTPLLRYGYDLQFLLFHYSLDSVILPTLVSRKQKLGLKSKPQSRLLLHPLLHLLYWFQIIKTTQALRDFGIDYIRLMESESILLFRKQIHQSDQSQALRLGLRIVQYPTMFRILFPSQSKRPRPRVSRSSRTQQLFSFGRVDFPDSKFHHHHVFDRADCFERNI